MDAKKRNWIGLVSIALAFVVFIYTGCSQITIPRFDPTGQRVFLPAGNRTSLSLPWPNCLQRLRDQRNATGIQLNPGIAQAPVTTQPAIAGQAPVFWTPTPRSSTGVVPQNLNPAVAPQFLATTDNKTPPCNYQGRIGSCLELKRKARQLGVTTGDAGKLFGRGARGELKMSPARIVAPVGSEVVVLAGICAGDGLFVPGQPIEFSMSQDSVGQMTDFGARERNPITKLISRRRTSGDFISSRTSICSEKIDRGTPTPVDDIQVQKGQTWVSVSSPTAGTSYITGVAPDAEAWDKRLATTEIQWVDAHWNIPAPVVVTAGSRYPLTVNIRKSRDGLGVDDWKVIYRIAGGAPAQFLPSGAQKAEVITGPDGNASVEIAQDPNKLGPGTTFVRVDIVRPTGKAGNYQVIESAITSVRWAAAAITMRAIGPKQVGINSPFAYRLEITNPGDQIARDVKITLDKLPEGLSFTSSTPKPTSFGDRFVWSVGDVAPNSNPKIVDIQLKAERSVGTARICFNATSSVDQLSTNVCAETQVVAPCIGLAINGPKETRVGEMANFKLEIVNQCPKDLTNLTAIVTYENGLEAPGFTGPLRLGPLKDPIKFNESKVVSLGFRVLKPGANRFRIDITADGGETGSIGRVIRGTNDNNPAISLQILGDGVTEVNKRVFSRLKVNNTGNVPLTNVIVNATVSNSLTPTRSAPESTAKDGQLPVRFELGTIAPGNQSEVILELQGTAIDGNGFVRYSVESDQGASDVKQQLIRVERTGSSGGQNPGINPGTNPGANPGTNPGTPQPNPGQGNGGGNSPGIAIPNRGGGPVARQLNVQLNLANSIVRREEVVPAEVVVRNLRNQPDQNLRVTITTPPGVQFIKLTNPNLTVTTSPDGSQHTVSPIRELRAGETVKIGFQFKAVQVGQATLEIKAQSDSSVVPISDDKLITITQS